jgi:hypothetical protein
MKTNIGAVILCAVMTLFVLYVHISGFTTSMIDHQTAEYNLERDYIANRFLEETVEIHRTHPVFSRRPMVTFLIDKVSFWLNVDTANAYVIVQFSLMFLSGLALFILSNLILKSHVKAAISVLSYYLSFTILFAFFTTNYTYANLLQYLLIFVSLIQFKKKHSVLGALFFGLSLYCHESGIVLIPGMYLIQHDIKPKKRILNVLGAIVLYGLLLVVTIGTEKQIDETSQYFLSRFEFYQFNFQNWRYASESFFSVFLASGVPAYLIWRSKEKGNFSEPKQGFWLGLALSIPLFFFLAKARESRLFATALVFVWPILGHYIQVFFAELRQMLTRQFQTNKWPLMFALVSSLGLSYILSYMLYQQTGQLPDSNFHNEFLFIALFAILLDVQLKMFWNKKHQLDQAMS